MPYIPQNRRLELAADLPDQPHTPGELNYAISSLLNHYVQAHGLCYQVINDILGACEGAKAEFYRRIAAPYEDTKLAANGDVYS